MKNIILFVLIFYSFSAWSQNDPQKMIDEFFNRYKSKGVDVGLDYLFGTNKWMSDSKDEIASVKFKLNNTIKLLGDYYGSDLIAKKTIGDKMILCSYFIRYERQPLRFTLQFYNPNGQWRLQNFSYDDSFDDELKEASKIYRLKENLPQ
jgi:hypothetical protein